MQKKSTEKPVKKFKKDPIKNREWEKDRRERLNRTFQQLAKLLPNSDDNTVPALSKIEIIQRTISFIGNLRQIIKEFRAGNNETILKNQEELEECLRELILRNRTLIELLKKANITIPSFAPISCRLFASMNATKNVLTDISDTSETLSPPVPSAATAIGENNFNELNVKNVGRPPKYSHKISKETAKQLNEANKLEKSNKKIKKLPQQNINLVNEKKEQTPTKINDDSKLVSTQTTDQLTTNNKASATIISNILPVITSMTNTTTTISNSNTTVTTTGVLVPLGNIKLHPQSIIPLKTNTSSPVIIVKSICTENKNKISERKIQPKKTKTIKCIPGKITIPAIKPSRIIFKTKHKRNRKKKQDNSENIRKKRKNTTTIESNVVTKKLKKIGSNNTVSAVSTVISSTSVTETTTISTATTATINTTAVTTTSNGNITSSDIANKEKKTNKIEEPSPIQIQLEILPPSTQSSTRHEILVNLPESTSENTTAHESLSPTAAFLMSFPVVSAAGAVRSDTDVVTEDITNSSNCLMQLDDLSGTVATTVESVQTTTTVQLSQPQTCLIQSQTCLTQLTPSSASSTSIPPTVPPFSQTPEKLSKPIIKEKATENILLENISSLFTTKDYDRFVEDVAKTEQNLQSSSNGFSLTAKEDPFDFQLKAIPQLQNNYQQKIYSPVEKSTKNIIESPAKISSCISIPTITTSNNSAIISDNIFTSPAIMTSSYSGSFNYFNKKQQFGTTSNIDFDPPAVAAPFTFSLTPTTSSYTLTNAGCNDNGGALRNSSASDCHFVRPPITQTSCGFYDSLSSIGSSSHHQRRTKPNAAIMYTSALSLSSSAVCSSGGESTIKSSIDTTNFAPQTPFTFSLTSSTNTHTVSSKIITTNTSSMLITTASPSIITTTTTNTSHHNTYNPFAFDNIPVATYHDNTQFSFCLTSTTTTPTTKTVANHNNQRQQHQPHHQSQQHQHHQHQQKKIKQTNKSSDTQTITNPFSIDYNLFGEQKQKQLPPIPPPPQPTVPPPVVALPFGICNAATPAPPPPPLAAAPPANLLTSDIESKKLYHKMSAIIGSSNNNSYYPHNSYSTPPHQNQLTNNKLKHNNQQKPHVNWMTSSSSSTSSSTMNVGTVIEEFNPTIPPPIDFTNSTTTNIPSYYPSTKSDTFYAHSTNDELPMTFPWSPNKMLDSSSMNSTTLPTLHGDLALNTFATKPITTTKQEKLKTDSSNTLLPPPPRIQRQPLPLPPPLPPSTIRPTEINIKPNEVPSNSANNNNNNNNNNNSNQTNGSNNFFSVSQLVDERKAPQSQNGQPDLNFNPKQMSQQSDQKSQKSNFNNRAKQHKDSHHSHHNQSSTTKQRINKATNATSSYVPIQQQRTSSNIFVDSFTYPNNQNTFHLNSNTNYQKLTQSNNYSTEALLSTNQQSNSSQSQRHQQHKKEKYLPIVDYYPNQMESSAGHFSNIDYSSGAADTMGDGGAIVNDYNYFGSTSYLSQNFMDNDYLGASCSSLSGSLLPTASNTVQQQHLYPPLYSTHPPPPPPPLVSQSSQQLATSTSSMKPESNQFLKLSMMPPPPPPPPPPPIPPPVMSSRTSEPTIDSNRKSFHKTNTSSYNNSAYGNGATNTSSSNYFSLPPRPPPPPTHSSSLSVTDDYHHLNHHHHHHHHYPHHQHHHQFSLPNYGGGTSGAVSTTEDSVSLPMKNPMPPSSSSSTSNILYPDQYSMVMLGTSSGGGTSNSSGGYQPHLLLPSSYHHNENSSIMPSPLTPSLGNNNNNNNNNNQSGHLVSNFNLSTICPEINDKAVVGGQQNW